MTQRDFISTRQSLLSRLKDWQDHESWRDFFNIYWKLIFSAALKSGLNPAEAEEVVQETIISIAKKMPEFKYDPARGSFKGWLLQLTRWKILDQLRKRRPQEATLGHPPGSDTSTSPIERIPDPAIPQLDSLWDEQWQKTILEAALERVKRRVSSKHYQIFDLYAIKQWPAEKVANTLRVSVGQVYLVKHKVSRLAKKELRQLEIKPV